MILVGYIGSKLFIIKTNVLLLYYRTINLKMF